MTVSALIQELDSLQIVLSIDGEQLRVSAPKGALTPELKLRIQSHRELIAELLKSTQKAESVLEPTRARDANEPAALTPAQHQLWFLDRLDPGSAFLNIPLVLRLRGKLDLDALSWVVTEIGRRHDALTSQIVEYQDEPFQSPSGRDLRLEFEDYSHLDGAERERIIQSRKEEEITRPFDFESRAPLARFHLFRSTRSEHLLVMVINHVVFDGPSQDILLREIEALYAARVQGLAMPPLSGLPFADFARWHKRLRQAPDRAAQLAYWRKQLDGMPVQLELPNDRQRQGPNSHASHHAECWLDRDLSERLRRVARAQRATVNMLALAGIQVLLWRYSGQSDFGIGVPLQNRGHQGFEQQVGMFLNTVVLRSDVGASSRFDELLSRVRDRQIDALSHGNVSFDELLSILSPGRTAQQSQLFQVFYSYQDGGEPVARVGELEFEFMPAFTGFAMMDLTFWMHDHGENFWIALEGAADIFDAETTARFFRSWVCLLEAIADDPSARLSELPVMSREDEYHVLYELNDTARAWNQDALLHRMFERVVDQRSDDVALLFEEQSLSYRELDLRANRLANLLVRRGVGPESLVGLCVHKGALQVVAMLAILKAGGAYVGLDPTYPDERIAQLLGDSEAKILISSSDIAPRIKTEAELFLIDRDAALLHNEPATRLLRPERSDQLAYIIYTSGSSGMPKGVMAEHRNVTSFLEAVHHAIGLDANDVWLGSASISFDMSVIEILGSLCCGKRLVMVGDSVLGEATNLRYTIPELIKRHGVTHFQCTPSQAQMLLLDAEGRAALAGLKQLLCGGEVVPEQLPTETTVYATLGPMEKGGRAIGRPIPNTRLFILDPSGRPVPKGAPGELCIGSPGVSRGYLKRPELTAERFMINTVRPEVSPRLYRSGDLVRYAADGTVLYVGRNDQQVKIRGFRIELGEIEAATRALPGVRDVVVVTRGNGVEKRLVSYVVTNADYQGDEWVQGELRAKLPEFMVPRVMVQLPALPLNTNGKVDRQSLPEPAAVGPTDRVYVAPRDERERRLCEIWQKALGVPRVGLTDNFFDLGGHSLMAVKISNEVERSFGLRLPLATLFECPTVEHFAKRLHEMRSEPALARAASWTTLVPIQPRGSLPPLFCVAGVGGNPMNLRHVAAGLGDDQPFYGLQFRGVDGQLPPHRRIRDMAEEFLADIRGVQPHGPYYLGGYSAGGLAAFEMAQLLRERGEQVGLVVFFDTVSPVLPPWPLLERLDAHVQNYRREGLLYLPNRLVARVREEIDSAVRAIRARLAQNYPFRYRHDAVWHASEQAIHGYVPEPYPGNVLLLRADPRLSRDGGIGHRPHESNGWRDFVRGELTVVELSCSHRDIVSAQAADLAARALKRALAAARAKNRKPRSQAAPATRPAVSVAELRPTESGGVRLTG